MWECRTLRLLQALPILNNEMAAAALGQRRSTATAGMLMAPAAVPRDMVARSRQRSRNGPSATGLPRAPSKVYAAVLINATGHKSVTRCGQPPEPFRRRRFGLRAGNFGCIAGAT